MFIKDRVAAEWGDWGRTNIAPLRGCGKLAATVRKGHWSAHKFFGSDWGKSGLSAKGVYLFVGLGLI